MNHTTNYNLSQWEATDKVQRVDFNADNAKIDAAIKAVDIRVDGLSGSKADQTAQTALQNRVAAAEAANLWVKLADVTTTERQQQIDIDLSQFNLSQFAAMKIYGQIKGAPLYVRLNGNTSGYSWGSGSPRDYLLEASTEGQYAIQGELSGFGSPVILGSLLYSGGESRGTTNSYYVSTVRTINLAAVRNGVTGSGIIFESGSRLAVYGLRR